MRVLIITPCLLPVPATKGGAVLTLVESIVKQNEIDKEIDLSVISSYESESEKKSKKYNSTNFIFLKKNKLIVFIDKIIDSILSLTVNKNKPKKNYLTKFCMLKKIKKVLKNNNYDKVIFENSGFLLNSVKSKRTQKKYQDKLYYHLHNDVPDNINIKILKKCKLLLVSNYLKEKLKTISGESIIDHCYIVRNGFNCAMFAQNISDKEKKEIKKTLHIDNDKKIILFTGRIKEEKGIGILVNAIEKLEAKNIVLLIIGASNFGARDRTKFENDLYSKIQKMKESIAFTGYIPYEQIWKYYKIADLAILPSIWNEPAGLTMLEASASALPLITTNSGGIKEYQEKNITILEINNDLEKDIIREIKMFLKNEKKYKEMALNAQKNVLEKYNEKVFYKDFVKSLNK